MSRAIEMNNGTPTEGFLTYNHNHGFNGVVGSIIQFTLDHSPRKPDLLKTTALLASFASAATVLGGAPKAFASSEKGNTDAVLKTGCILTTPKLNKDTNIVKTVADCRFKGRRIPASQLRFSSLDVVTAQWPGVDTKYIVGDPNKPIRGKSGSLAISDKGLNKVTFTVTTANKYGANKAGKGGSVLKKTVTASFEQGGEDQVVGGMVDSRNLPTSDQLCDFGKPSGTAGDPNKCGLIIRENPKSTTPIAFYDTKPHLISNPDGSEEIVAPHQLSPGGRCDAMPITDPLRKSPWGEIKQLNYFSCRQNLYTGQYFIAWGTNLAGDTCQLEAQSAYDVLRFKLANSKAGGVVGVGYFLNNYNGDPTKGGTFLSTQTATAYLYLPKGNTGDICAGQPIIITAAEAAAARASSALPTTTTSR